MTINCSQDAVNSPLFHRWWSNKLLLMVCIYLFLFIERPWESISLLRDLPIERPYVVLLLIIAFLANRLRLRGVTTDKWVLGLLIIHFILSPFAYLPSKAFDQSIEYAKLVVMYILFLSCCDDEQDLYLILKTFVLSMIFYVLHSYWEYLNGRHYYRMEISRMLGVGDSLSDPNTFAASIVLSLPIVWVVFSFEENKWLKRIYLGYVILAFVCVVLTGSRTGFMALIFLMGIVVFMQKGTRKLTIVSLVIAIISVGWLVMPEEKKVRIQTIWDAEAGPANAHTSTEGRIYGFEAGMKMFKSRPLTGIGPGSENFIRYRIEKGDGVNQQAHNLAGEVLGELGLLGTFAFLGLIICTFRQFRKCRASELDSNRRDSFLSRLGAGGMILIALMLVFGIAGHNFYRPIWLWLAAWSSLGYSFSSQSLEVKY